MPIVCVLNRWSIVEVSTENRWQLHMLIGSKHTPYFSESTDRAGDISHQEKYSKQKESSSYRLESAGIVHIHSNFKELEKVENIKG